MSIDWGAATQAQSSGINWGAQPKPPAEAPSFWGGVKSTAAKGGAKILDVLNRPSMAGVATFEHGLPAGVQTFMHSEAPEQYQKDTADLARRMQGLSEEEYAKRPGWERAANEMAVQLLVDPTTYIGGLGIERRAVEAGTERLLPAALHAMEKLGKAPGQLGEAARQFSEKATTMHDFMMGGGKPAAHALRKLAYDKGPEGIQEFQRHYSIRQRGMGIESSVESALNRGIDRSVQSLSDADQMKVFNAIHEGTIDSLPANLKNAALGLQAYVRGARSLAGTNPLRTRLEKEGMGLPEDLKAYVTKSPVNKYINKPGMEHGLFPFDHELMEVIHPKDETRLLKQALEIYGGDVEKMGKELAENRLPQDPRLVRDLLRSHVAQIAEHVRDTHILDQVRGELGYTGKKLPSYLADFYKPEKFPEASILQKMQDISKATMFWSPLGHMMRISSLLAAHSPFALGKAVGKFAKMRAGFANEHAIASALGDAVAKGATGSNNIEQGALEDMFAKWGAGKLAKTPLGKPLQFAGKAAGKWYGGVGKMLWGWDEASKAALFDEYAKMYKRWDPEKKMSVPDPLRAAYHVQQDLVNYGAPSPFIRGAGRTASAFPTWRTRMPVAVARAIAKHPQVAANLARTAPWLFGQPFQMGDEQKEFYGSALSEGAGALGLGPEGGYGPLKYLRSSLRPGIKEAFAVPLAVGAQTSDPKHAPFLKELAKWWTGGEPVGTMLAKEEIPYASLAMDLMSGDPKSAALFQLLNIGEAPKAKARTRPVSFRKTLRPGAKKPSPLWWGQ